MGKLISDSPTISKGDSRKSMAQNTSVGSGSRPTASRVKIATSSPSDPHGLSRKPSGSLK